MAVELIIQPSSADRAPNDPRSRRAAEVDELRSALKRKVEVLPTPAATVDGKKGVEVATMIIVALGNAGVFAAVTSIYNGWLNQGRGRTATLTVKDGDREKTIDLKTEGMSAATFEKIVLDQLAK